MDELKIHNISVQEVTSFGAGGAVITRKQVTFSIGTHGPFTKVYDPPKGTANDIKADILAQRDELAAIHELGQ